MAQPRIVMAESPRVAARAVDTRQVWNWAGWCFALLALVGIGDFVLAWVPPRIGVPEWEFATVVQTFSGLPLVTIGLLGGLCVSFALGRRRVTLATAVLVLLFAVVVFAALILFLLDVPLALRAAQGPATLGVQKAIIKTLLLGVAFGGAYLVSGIAALRMLKRERKP